MPQRHNLGPVSALPAVGGKAFDIAGKRISVFRVADRLYAIDDTCNHEGGPLCEGEVENGVVTCPWHGAQFDLATGKVLCGPALEDVASYPVTVRDGAIELEA